jgi:DNA-binding XRE family transcriptional regulator
LFGQPERRVGNHPIDLRAIIFQKILARGNVGRPDLAESLGQNPGHMPIAAGRLQTGLSGEVLRRQHVREQSPRRPRRSWKIIQPGLRQTAPGHHGVRPSRLGHGPYRWSAQALAPTIHPARRVLTARVLSVGFQRRLHARQGFWCQNSPEFSTEFFDPLRLLARIDARNHVTAPLSKGQSNTIARTKWNRALPFRYLSAIMAQGVKGHKKRQNEERSVTAEEFRDALERLGWSQTKAAQRLGLSLRTINRYASGQTPVKRPVEIVLKNATELVRRP